MPTYVRGFHSDTWHWCWNCSEYPPSIALRRGSTPKRGALCNQCSIKQREGSCRDTSELSGGVGVDKGP
jgi:hypothetical protein